MATGARSLVEELLSVVDPFVKDGRVTGLVLGALEGDDRAIATVGTRSSREGTPVTSDTVFRYCSVTKTFTALAVLIACQEGVLDLDAAVGEILPDLPLSERDSITIRHLLQHSSGLEGAWPSDVSSYGQGDRALEELIADYGCLRQFTPPGTTFGYCNPGYWLLGYILSVLDGKTFEEVLTRRVLGPLGLRDVSVLNDHSGLPVALPHGSVDGDNTAQLPHYVFPRARVPSGGLVGTAPQLLDLAHDLMAGQSRILDPSFLARMVDERVPAERPGRYWGLGWAVEASGSALSHGHTGTYRGFVSLLQVFPADRAAVVLLANSATALAAQEAVKEEALHHWGIASAPKPTYLPLGRYKDIVGTYLHPVCRQLTVEPHDNDCLKLTLDGYGSGTVVCLARRISASDFMVVSGPESGCELQFLTTPLGVIRFDDRLGVRQSGMVPPVDGR